MPYTLVRHKVKDYSIWKPFFDENVPNRPQYGFKEGIIFRNIEEPNELYLLLEWEDLDQAQQFFNLEELRKVMGQAGVVDEPDIYYLEIADRPTE